MVDEVHLSLLGLCPLPALWQRTQRLTAGVRAGSVHRQLLQLLLKLLVLLLLQGRRRRRLLLLLLRLGGGYCGTCPGEG